MPTKERVDLVELFGTVTQALAENQQGLDRLDEYNHDHGDNMVQTFQTITQALEKKRGSSDSAALGYAARQLSRNARSSSSKLYAENLAQAATQFKGKRVDEKGALDLLTTLIGAGQAGSQPASQPAHSMPQQPAGGDMLAALMGGAAPQQQTPQGGDDLLGALLGGMGGGSQQSGSTGGDLLGALLGGMGGGSQQPTSSSGGGGDLLGALLGGMTGQGGSSQSGQSGFGLQNLLAAGLAYMQAKQTGQGGMQALLQAAAAGSGMGNSAHREQSTQVVVQAFLQALSGMKARQ